MLLEKQTLHDLANLWLLLHFFNIIKHNYIDSKICHVSCISLQSAMWVTVSCICFNRILLFFCFFRDKRLKTLNVRYSIYYIYSWDHVMAKIILLLSRCFDEKKCCLFFVLITVYAETATFMQCNVLLLFFQSSTDHCVLNINISFSCVVFPVTQYKYNTWNSKLQWSTSLWPLTTMWRRRTCGNGVQRKGL